MKRGEKREMEILGEKKYNGGDFEHAPGSACSSSCSPLISSSPFAFSPGTKVGDRKTICQEKNWARVSKN